MLVQYFNVLNKATLSIIGIQGVETVQFNTQWIQLCRVARQCEVSIK